MMIIIQVESLHGWYGWLTRAYSMLPNPASSRCQGQRCRVSQPPRSSPSSWWVGIMLMKAGACSEPSMNHGWNMLKSPQKVNHHKKLWLFYVVVCCGGCCVIVDEDIITTGQRFYKVPSCLGNGWCGRVGDWHHGLSLLQGGSLKPIPPPVALPGFLCWELNLFLEVVSSLLTWVVAVPRETGFCLLAWYNIKVNW